MRLLTRGLGGSAHTGLITIGLGPLIVELVRIIRGGRTVIRDVYGDKLEEFKMAASLVAINGKELFRPIFNKKNYTIYKSTEADVRVNADRVKKRKKNIFEVFAKKLKIKRGSDGND